MATFTGTNANEIITPAEVSPTVAADPPGARPGDLSDVIMAGGGDDIVIGGEGDDIVDLGGGDDRFTWHALEAAGDDVVDGGAGVDAVRYFGIPIKGAGDNVALTPSGGGLTIANGGSTVALSGIEIVNVLLGNGSDALSLQDLRGSGVTRLSVDLAAVAGGNPDGDLDTLMVNGSARGDTIRLADKDGAIGIGGLGAAIKVSKADATDLLRVAGDGGRDTIDAGKLSAGKIKLIVEAGNGADAVIGSKGRDSILGGAGRDALKGGAGSDLIVGGADRDTLSGGAGADQFLFNLGDARSGADRILDLRPGVDTILLDAPFLGEAVERGEFRYGTEARDGDDHILYHRASGVVRLDVDGAGGEDAFAFAKVGKGLNLTFRDFDVLID